MRDLTIVLLQLDTIFLSKSTLGDNDGINCSSNQYSIYIGQKYGMKTPVKKINDFKSAIVQIFS